MISEYDSSFLCTYKNIDDDDLYRIQFLQAFKLSNWDDTRSVTGRFYYSDI